MQRQPPSRHVVEDDVAFLIDNYSQMYMHRAAPSRRGSIELTLDEGGPLTWTLEFQGRELNVKKGPDPSAHARISATPSTWAAIATGEYDLARGVAAGEISFQGDRELLRFFAATVPSERTRASR